MFFVNRFFKYTLSKSQFNQVYENTFTFYRYTFFLLQLINDECEHSHTDNNRNEAAIYYDLLAPHLAKYCIQERSFECFV